MSVLITYMEMPDKCGHCRFANAFDCTVTGSFISTHSIRQPDCPLVPVPKHGRLIDADALAEMLEKYKTEYALKAKEDIVHLHKAWGLHEAELMAESLPTIIQADPAEEGDG